MELRLGKRVQEAQQRLARAVTVGRLQNDPLADMVEALSQSLLVQFEDVAFANTPAFPKWAPD